MPDIDTDRLVWIVTGVHLTAELGDRPLAYRVETELRARLSQKLPAPLEGEQPRWAPVVVSDVYYLNHSEAQSGPAISIGGPGVNMLSGTWVEQIPMALAIENVLVVQMDLESSPFRACVWGMSHVDTIRAVDVFVTRYLDGFIDALVRANP
jgi:hypothetical protein